MSKQPAKSSITNEQKELAKQLATLPNDKLVGKDTAITMGKAFELLEIMPEGTMKDVSAEYWTPEDIGIPYYFLATGVSLASFKEGQQTEVVDLVDKKGMSFICGDKVLLSAVRRLKMLPAFVKIIYVGDAESSKGTYKRLKVFTFYENSNPSLDTPLPL